VQVGDPFTEKLLIEACLELMASDAIVAIQDMGAAGLTSSSVEMASKGGVGLELNLDDVPCRETGMTPYEMMLSESQERMLMILKPGREAFAEAIFHKWELDFAVIGRVTDTGHLVLKFKGETAADIPLAPLADKAPAYERPWVPTPKRAEIEVPAGGDLGDALLKLIASPDLASKRWIWEQYDHMVGADTIGRPGGDAAVVRVHGSKKALAITTDCNPRYCFADPVEGGRQAIAEAWRNLTAVGATPLATTDCMNFGNPQRPEIMGQFVGCLKGIAEACRALDFPVVSGNVSLYNETNGRGILPTPSIGGVGLLDDFTRSATLAFKAGGEAILLIGETQGWLGQSVYLRDICGREEGAPPPVDLAAEKRNGDVVRGMIHAGTATAAHDLSDGGLLIALAEMAIAGGIGARLLAAPAAIVPHAWWFGEDQARYIVTVPEAEAGLVLAKMRGADIPCARIGTTGGDAIAIVGEAPVSVKTLDAAFESWLPAYMNAKV
ncbi:MAG: phosphoribosylformylglycinamidine synthase subunit PurL, partial [Bradyrhizobium sp.]|nr:phosphoribosylformylglycinamidine synthase subunit PurL [Bradyrhizobium sp.]